MPGEVVTDDGVAAVVAERLDLAEQAEDAAVAPVRVLVQVGLERVELARARPLPAAVDEFLPGGGAVVALDGVQSPAQVAGDLPQAAPLGSQPVDQGVVAPRAVGELPCRVRCALARRPCRRGGLIADGGHEARPGLWFWLCQAAAVGGDALLDGLREVLPQVEPVGDLNRLRCPGAGTIRIRARAVPADHLDAGVSGQPVRERLGVAALQHVKRRAGLAVDQQRAVYLAAPDREVIDLPRCRGNSTYPDPGIIPTADAARPGRPWWEAGR